MLAALAAGASTVAAGAGSQDVEAANRGTVSSHADASNSGAADAPGAIATGPARSRVDATQQADNRQRTRAARCRARACAQRARLRNRAAVAARADSSNSGDALGGARIRTGSATSAVSLHQAAADEQAGRCGPAACAQLADLANQARIAAGADASNARDARPGATVATRASRSAVLVSQAATSHHTVRARRTCPPAICAQRARGGNAARVVARAGAATATAPGAGGGRAPNLASIRQDGRANAAALQQVDQHVLQIGRVNVVRNVVRETLVFRGAELAARSIEVHSTRRSHGRLPRDLGPAAWRTRSTRAAHCRSPAGARASTVRCEEANAATVRQAGRENLAAVQQSGQQIRQVGLRNRAVNVLVQVVVLRAPGPRVRAAFAGCGPSPTVSVVQQGSQAIRQLGRRNRARNVIRRTVRIAPGAVPARGRPRRRCPPARAYLARAGGGCGAGLRVRTRSPSSTPSSTSRRRLRRPTAGSPSRPCASDTHAW